MQYPFVVFKAAVEDREFWVAESKGLKGCVAQGDTVDEAIRILKEHEIIWIETAQEVGISIPEIAVEQIPEYSGKFTLRMSTKTHQDAALSAEKLGISLNQFVNDALVTYNNTNMLKNTLHDLIKKEMQPFAEQISDKIDSVRATTASASDDFTDYYILGQPRINFDLVHVELLKEGT